MDGLPFDDDTFDLVQLRAFGLVFSPDQWPGILKEIYRVTRPGGCVQLMEDDGDEYIRSCHERLMKTMLEFDLDPLVCIKLGQYLKDSGFSVIQEEKRRVDLSKDLLAREFLSVIEQTVDACQSWIMIQLNHKDTNEYLTWKDEYVTHRRETSESVWHAVAGRKCTNDDIS
ncbi:hypothetical protein DFQ28_005109 [Apophysomyces sp. BC1034]|nr:hypothetical protein DFQ29_001729 [Apophysomyces sp. BC1021]KAG0188312.1 hypothetical protein DFQ28_005109 [Apophysomyces sp. BC1034]